MTSWFSKGNQEPWVTNVTMRPADQSRVALAKALLSSRVQLPPDHTKPTTTHPISTVCLWIHDDPWYVYVWLLFYMDCTDHWCKNLVGTSPTSAGVSSTISHTNATWSKSWVPERWETVEALLWESSNPNRYFRIYIYYYYYHYYYYHYYYCDIYIV